ncbi:MAG: thiamine phosphate synthase [Deltaproteobacteria bacterium]|nr:thiamine phosphate synthase [Deltaproteobacteria bacterium]
MSLSDAFGFYGILTEPRVGHERLAAIMVEQGVAFVQLRMKNASYEEVLDMARRLRPIIRGDSRFIINDDPRLAVEVGADGLHLGQDDMPYLEARSLLGPDVIIGLSTHSPAQTRAACALDPDYIGVGPVYATPTKRIADPVIGLQGLKEMLAESTVPTVAIGGIDHVRAPEVLAAGANNLCAVRCINQAEDPARALERILQLIQDS